MREGSVVCNGSYGNVVKNEFCREFLCDLEKNEEQSIFVIPKYDRLNGTPVEPEGDDDREIVRENLPLSQFTTKEDYRPNSSSIMTYVKYFWTGGLFMTVILIILTVLSN